MSKIKTLLAGNWKMNGTSESLVEIDAIVRGLQDVSAKCDLLICPPNTLLWRVSEAAKGSALMSGGQNCNTQSSGAHTGDTSALMLKDAGASHVILGHSERRADHHETDGLIRAKAEAALAADLIPIVCVGETLSERQTGLAETVVEQQLQGSLPNLESHQQLIVAYEPVWAIGTGEVPSIQDIAAMHQSIRNWLADKYEAKGEAMAILYGGSLKPNNATEILAINHVNGGLIGGASLNAKDFLSIAACVN